MTPNKSDILKIEDAVYTGYLWYSDDTSPKILESTEYQLERKAADNPFIIEGQLFDGTNSISVKYVDGGYIVTHHIVKNEDYSDRNVEKLTFVANRMNGIAYLKFLQYWEPEKDELCDNMSVLRPTKMVFVGFDKSTKIEEN